MKTVRIQAHQIGLLFKHEGFQRVLTQGKYWVWPTETAYVYNRGEQLQNPPLDLAVLLDQPEVAAALDVVDVQDNEIALQYENGLYKNILRKGRYAFWKGRSADARSADAVERYTYVRADLNQLTIPADIDLASLMPAPLGAYVRTFAVEAHERGVLFIDWAFDRVLQPGTYQWWKNNTLVHVLKVDMRQQQLEVAGQEILTKDKASLRVSFFVQYQVRDVLKVVIDNKDFDKQLYVAVQLALREYIGTLTLDELLERKGELAPFVLNATASKAAQLGVELGDGGLRDVILPGDMRDIMNQVLMAEKRAQANSIMRREETASTRSLLNTAKLMEDNAMLWKLKEMEYVEKIADKINTISVSNSGPMVDQLKQLFVR